MDISFSISNVQCTMCNYVDRCFNYSFLSYYDKFLLTNQFYGCIMQERNILKGSFFMQKKSMANWLKIIIIGMGIIGLAFYGLIVPLLGDDIVSHYPEYSSWYYWWTGFLWLTAVPCYIVLYFAWKISTNIGKDNSFCKENAISMKHISTLVAGDSIFFFAGNIIYLVMGFNHPSVVLASLLVVFIGISIAGMAAVLSHLILRAAQIKEENDLTI